MKTQTQTNKQKHFFWISILVSSFVFMFFFRAHWAFRAPWESDEGCYLAQIGKYLQANTHLICQRGENHYAPGTAWTWLPAGFIARLFYALFGGRLDGWTVPWLAVWSFGLWGVGLYFFTSTFSRQIEKIYPYAQSVFLSYATVFSIPILFYAVQTPIMAHSAEFAIGSVVYYLVERDRITLAALTSVLLTLIRYNDAPVFAVVLATALQNEKKGLGFQHKIILILTTVIVISITAWIGFIHGYGGGTVKTLIHDFKWKNIAQFFVGNDWGALWLFPIWSLVLLIFPFFGKRFSKTAWAAWLWMLANAVLVIFWGTNGSRYGQRYLIGSFIGLALITPEALTMWPCLRSTFYRLSFLVAGWGLFTTSAYESVTKLGIFPFDAGFDSFSFLIESMLSVFDPEFWKTIFLYQIPAVTLWFSVQTPQQPEYKQWSVDEPGIIVLWLALLIAIVLFALSIWKLTDDRQKKLRHN